MASVNLCRDIAVYALSMAAETRCLFALGVVVLVLVELFWPDRLALLRAVVLLEVVRVGSLVAAALFPALVVCGVAQLAGNRGRVRGVTSPCRIAVFDVLDALRLVRVGEPVLAHVE